MKWQVRIVKLHPEKVIVEQLPEGKIVEWSRTFFERRLAMGLIEVVNPEVLPVAL
jgi:hypothetical protein